MGDEKMSVETKQELPLVSEIIQALFSDCGFDGFRFNTSFSLRFTRDKQGQYEDQNLPWAIELLLEGDWWFDAKDTWDIRVSNLAPADSVDPEEPIQAYDLAHLRWSEGSGLESVKISSEFLVLTFKNGKILSVSSKPIEGPSWIVESVGDEDVWSVVCEGGEFFATTKTQ